MQIEVEIFLRANHQYMKKIARGTFYGEMAPLMSLFLIILNGSAAGYKNTCKFIKTILILKFGKSYFQHFKHVSPNVKFKLALISKVVNRITDS